MLPITSPSGTNSAGLSNFSDWNDVPIFFAPTGRCKVTGFLITRSNFSEPCEDLMLSLYKS